MYKQKTATVSYKKKKKTPPKLPQFMLKSFEDATNIIYATERGVHKGMGHTLVTLDHAK